MNKLSKYLDNNFKKTKTLTVIDLERKKKGLPCVTGNNGHSEEFISLP